MCDITIRNYDNMLSCYTPDFDIITLGKEFKIAINIFSEKDFDMYLNDCIIHEFIHSILQKQFSGTVSRLFDSIEHLFNNGFSIKEKLFEHMRVFNGGNYPRTWRKTIEEEGLDTFFNIYHLDNINLIQAYILCNGI